jgi:hypothetical protein
MGDPLLISLDERTGEGVLQLDDGSREYVHMPSVPDLIYTDARETGAPQGARSVQLDTMTIPRAAPVPDDGILSGERGRPRVTYSPQADGMQVPAILPPQRSALYAEQPPTVSPDPLDPMGDRGPPPVRAAPPPPQRPLTPAQLDAQREALIGGYAGLVGDAEAPVVGMPSTRGLVGVPQRAPEAPTVGTRASLERPLFAEAAPIPSDVPAEWLVPQAGEPVAPGAPPVPRGMRGPTPEEVARGRAPVVDGVTPSRRTTAAGPRGMTSAPSPRTPVISPQVVRDFSQAEDFDGTIAGITGQRQGTRGSPGNPFDLVDRQTAIAQREAQAAGDDARRQQQAVAASEDERRRIETERQGAMSQAMGRYQRAIDRVASARVDPNHWFRDQGAFGTVGATIAVALGALGSAISGSSTNGALEGINQAIERDLDAQRSEIDAGRAAADLEGNMLSVVGREFSDRDAAREAARAAMLSQAELELQAQTADIANDEALVNAEALRAQLAQARATAEQAALDAQSQRDLRAAQARRFSAQAMRDEHRAMGGGAARPQRYTTPMYEAFERAIAGGASREEAARQTGFAPEDAPRHSSMTTEQRAPLDAMSAALDSLEAQLPPMGEGDIPGVGFYDSLAPGPQGRLFRQEIENTMDLLARLRSGANAPTAEIDRFMAILGAGTFQTEEEFRNGLRIVRRDLAARLGRSGEREAAPDRELASFGGTWIDEGSTP